MVDPPLDDEDKPAPDVFGRVAIQLLIEMAERDPELADRLRREGILREDGG
jgi:hypothetical protein